MKLILLKSVLIFLASFFLSSCKKDRGTFNDYLPLKVGARYLYSCKGNYQELAMREKYFKLGECQWEFTDMTTDTPYEDGKVKITFPTMYFQIPTNIITERFLESSKIDTCFGALDNICLSKNIGIKYINDYCKCNHQIYQGYTLIKGPY